jgi:hypothetical protein
MPYSSAAQTLDVEATPVRVASRFNGPPGSGNGGYTVGLLGRHLGPDVEVTLRRPIPLDRPMRVFLQGPERAALVHDGAEIAIARRAELDIDIPETVSFSRAAAARATYPGYIAHPFPTCFVCGTSRGHGDGMCLFTGIVGDGIVASSWVPTSALTGEDDVVSPELTAAALDCPGAWALIARYGLDSPIVLGRMAYRFDKPIYRDGRYVVMGWALGRERRKGFCGTAVYDAEGNLCAVASSTWIQIG